MFVIIVHHKWTIVANVSLLNIHKMLLQKITKENKQCEQQLLSNMWTNYAWQYLWMRKMWLYNMWELHRNKKKWFEDIRKWRCKYCWVDEFVKIEFSMILNKIVIFILIFWNKFYILHILHRIVIGEQYF